MFTNFDKRPPQVESRHRAIVLSLGLALGYGAVADAQTVEIKTLEPGVKKDNPKARALFEEVANSYKALRFYSDQGEFVFAFRIGAKGQKQVVPMKMTFARPNKLDFDAGQVRITSDGTTLTTAVLPLKRYTATPAPKTLGIDTFREGPIGAMIFGGPAGAHACLAEFSDRSGSSRRHRSVRRHATSRPGRRHKGCRRQSPELDVDYRIRQRKDRLSADGRSGYEADFLDRDESRSGTVVAGITEAQEVAIEKFGWKAGAIATDPPNGHTFVYEAPKNFAKVDSLTEREAPKDHSLLGKPAPEFTLTVLDGPGKTKTITKAELAGTVVVIDFWATWCGPCMQELPEIQKLIESYADSKKHVVIIALSQDEEPAELSQVRKLVEKTLNEKKLALSAAPVGLVGLDPSKSVGGAFELEGYPTLVILDDKGIVQSVHVGYDPSSSVPLNKSLAKEIDTLLGGKPLVTKTDTSKEASKKSEE